MIAINIEKDKDLCWTFEFNPITEDMYGIWNEPWMRLQWHTRASKHKFMAPSRLWNFLGVG
jgi:hypothetical protein